MKRPLFVLLTGLVLGEASAYVSGGTGVFVMALFMLMALWFYVGFKFRQSHFSFCVPGSDQRRKAVSQKNIQRITVTVFLLSVSGLLGASIFQKEAYPDLRETHLAEHTDDCELQGRIVSVRWKEDGTSQIVLKRVVALTGDPNNKLQEKQKLQGQKEEPMRGHVLLLLSVPEEGSLQPDDMIRVSGSLKLLEPATNPGEFDSQIYHLAQGIRLQLYGEDWKVTNRGLFSVRAAAYYLKLRIARVYRLAMSEEEAALLKAMALGDKSGLSEEQRTMYSQNGVAHLLAVSGLHVSILGGSLFRLMRKRGFRYISSCLSGSLVLLFYGCMTGFGSSSARAITMYLVFLTAQFLGADYDMISAMSLSGFLMLLEHPWKLLEGGFQISFLSILALGLVLPWAKETLQKARMKEKQQEKQESDEALFQDNSAKGRIVQNLKNAFFASMIISGVTTPALLAVFYEWAPCSLVLNLIFLPCMEPLMIFSVCGGLAGLLLSPAGRLMLLPARGILLLFQGIFSLSEYLPVRAIITGCPGLWQLAVIYLLEFLLFIMWIHSGTVRRILLLTILCTICAMEQNGSLSLLASMRMPPGTMNIHMLDVGQGESILIRTPDRKCLLIDGGSTSRSDVGQYVMLPALKYYGVKKLDYVIATHMDEDHISGIQELFDKNYTIKCILLPDAGKNDKAWQTFYKAAAKTGAVVKTIACGDQLRLHSLLFTCLHPVRDYDPEDRNDTSVVLYLSYQQFDMLFTGDLGEEGEQMLGDLLTGMTGMAAMTSGTGGRLSYRQMLQDLDVLKVAHHGSRYSTSDRFLELFPELKTAMISAGRGNRYGHPHKELVERLETKGIKVWITKEGGAISLKTDGKRYRMRSFLSHSD